MAINDLNHLGAGSCNGHKDTCNEIQRIEFGPVQIGSGRTFWYDVPDGTRRGRPVSF